MHPARLLLPLALSVATVLATIGSARAELTLETVLSGLSEPVRLVAPEGDDRIFVVERGGRIRVFDRDGTDRGAFLDVSHLTRVTVERGLLGLAFAPDYASTGRFYVSLTDDDPSEQSESQLYRYRVSADPDVADPASGELIFTLFQPFSNHNGGHIEFGPDGMLYYGLGDGGGQGDPGNNAQDPQSLLGKLLRLDVSGSGVPAVPPDNPFVGEAPRDEIWALGLRNPWCFSFDPLTGDLYIADVGEALIEEVDIQPASSGGGENYGWRLMEGSSCFDPPSGCNDGSLVLPVHDYTHAEGGCSISGGYVYRGEVLEGEDGNYFFADLCSGKIWTLRWTAAGGLESVTERTAELTADLDLNLISSFGRDGSGELYLIENFAGRIHRIVPATTTGIGGRSGSTGRLKGKW